MTAPVRVLVAEDDLDLQEMLREMLEGAGMTVQTADDGAAALIAVGQDDPDIVLLDLDLPDLDGLDVLRAVRRRGATPVIVLTGRRGEDDRVNGLERGADDYVMKPFSSRELVARIRSVLRRADPGPEPGRVTAPEPDLCYGPVAINRAARVVTIDGRSVELTKREFDLLAFLASHPLRVFSRQDLLNEVWGSSEDWQVPATVTEHIRRIRQKVEPDPSAPVLIHNIRGVGYRFGA